MRRKRKKKMSWKRRRKRRWKRRKRRRQMRWKRRTRRRKMRWGEAASLSAQPCGHGQYSAVLCCSQYCLV